MKIKRPFNVEDISLLRTAPDRFWRRVVNHVDKGRLTRAVRGGNNLFHECCRFLRRWDKAEAHEYDALYRDFPTVMPAYMIYQEDAGLRWYIEAGLTSDASISDVGKYVNERDAVIARYGQLFYDVKGWLESEGCIAAHVLRPRAMTLGQVDGDFLYKTVAYAYGWDVFKAFVSVKALPIGTRTLLQDAFRDALLKNGWLAVHKVRLNNHTVIEAIAQCLNLDTLKVQENTSGALTGQQDMNVITSMVEQFKMEILPEPELKPAELTEKEAEVVSES